MKKFNLSFVLILFALSIFTSCQDEVTEITQPTNEETIVANSPLASAMLRTATRDGSLDNILDAANCLSIELPVTVIVNGIEIVIDSVEDYDIIEAIFNEFNNDDDNLEIVFPITIILSDFTEIVIESYQELEVFIAECSGENESDDDIECIDFAYPITISVYDSNFQVIETVVIENDQQLYVFIENLGGGVLASINFPVTMILADGSTMVVNNNSELLAAINNADDTCDEDDDNDYNDDNNNDIPANDFVELLTQCSWTVDVLEVDDQDLEEQYVGYVFHFNSNGTVVVTSNGTEITGTWEFLTSVPGTQISLNIPDLPDFNNEHWILHEIEEHDGEFKIDFRNGEDRLRFERHECGNNPTSCTESDVDGYLEECIWQIVNFNGSNDLIDFQLDFMSNQALMVTGQGLNLQGTWSTSQSANGGVEVVISNIAGPGIQAINGSWVVTDCQPHRLEMQMGDNHLVIEQDCSSNNDPLGCLEAGTIVMCDENNDGVEVFNLYEGLSEISGCTVNTSVVVSYHTTLEDAQNNTNPLASVTTYTNISNPQTIYVRVQAINNPDQFEVLEIGLFLENCSNITVEEVVNTVVEGTWIVASYIHSGNNEASIYSNYHLNFNANGTVVATDGGSSTFYGTWSAFLDSNNDIRFLIDFGSNPPFDEFNDDWYVFDLQNNRIELHDNSSNSGSTDILVFERI